MMHFVKNMDKQTINDYLMIFLFFGYFSISIPITIRIVIHLIVYYTGLPFYAVNHCVYVISVFIIIKIFNRKGSRYICRK